jgi:zinc transporter ZupT
LKLVTASAGILGAIVALYYSTAVEAGDATSWILPFTSGGFLYISLVGIVPDMLKEKNFLVSVKQFMSLLFGIVIIYVLAAFFE